jgi:predicted transcriptional regulator
MNVLLSINPGYINRIMKGEKKYEFRKRIFKRRDIEHVYMYSTSPVSKIIGWLSIETILEGSPEELWEICYLYSGITEEEYFCYFEGKKKAFAIKIKDVKAFDDPIDPYVIFDSFFPPQSFCYLDEDFLFSILQEAMRLAVD